MATTNEQIARHMALNGAYKAVLAFEVAVSDLRVRLSPNRDGTVSSGTVLAWEAMLRSTDAFAKDAAERLAELRKVSP